MTPTRRSDPLARVLTLLAVVAAGLLPALVVIAILSFAGCEAWSGEGCGGADWVVIALPVGIVTPAAIVLLLVLRAITRLRRVSVPPPSSRGRTGRR